MMIVMTDNHNQNKKSDEKRPMLVIKILPLSMVKNLYEFVKQ